MRTKPDSFLPSGRLALTAAGAFLLITTLLYSRVTAFRQSLSVFADAGGNVTLQAAALAQAGEDDEESQIAPEQIDKYVAVYKAMQQNHSLSVDQATAAQGLSVDAFREIESRIERDDLIRDRVRQALRPGGNASAHIPSGSASPAPAK